MTRSILKEFFSVRAVVALLFLLIAAPAVYAAAPLPAPQPVYPLNGEVLSVRPGHKLMIKWNAVPGANQYVLLVESKESPGAPWRTFIKQEVGRITGYGFVFPSVTYGRWRVWAVTKDGMGGVKCPWQDFKFRQP